MKIIMCILILGSLSAQAHASPSTDCFTLAMNDSKILVATKTYYDYPTSASNYAKAVESVAVSLCARTITAIGPIECLKTTLANDKILSATKTYYGYPTSAASYAMAVEETVVRLCAGQ